MLLFLFFAGESKCNFTGFCNTPSGCQNYSTCQSREAGFRVSFVITEAEYSEIGDGEQRFKQQLVTQFKEGFRLICVSDVETKSGSINISFVVVPDQGQSAQDLQNAITALQTAIASGSFNITLLSGRVVRPDSSSFESTPLAPQTTAAPTSTPTESGGLSDTDIIIICCCVGGFVLIVIIAVVAYCCTKKKKQGSVSPNQSRKALQEDLEMIHRGKDHPGKLHEFLWSTLQFYTAFSHFQ